MITQEIIDVLLDSKIEEYIETIDYSMNEDTRYLTGDTADFSQYMIRNHPKFVEDFKEKNHYNDLTLGFGLYDYFKKGNIFT